jgi:transcription-repair coupling factor (superfamily II helicase)
MDKKSLLASPSLVTLADLFKKGSDILIEGLWDSPKALISFLALESTKKNILFITSSLEENKIFEDLHFFIDSTLEFPAWETLSTEEVGPSEDIIGVRLKTLKTISRQNNPCITITTLQACLQKVLAKDDLNKRAPYLEVKKNYPFKDIPSLLENMGYKKVSAVLDKGQFSIRGCIVDIFSVADPEPVRIEFFDDEIESIRIFDTASQKSIKKIDKIELLPALEESKNQVTLLDYLGSDTLVIFDDLLKLEERYVALKEMLGANSQSKSFISLEDFLNRVLKHQKCFFSKENIDQLSDIKRLKEDNIAFSIFNQEFASYRFYHPFVKIEDLLFDEEEEGLEELIFKLPLFFKKDFSITILSSQDSDEASFKKRLEDLNLNLYDRLTYERGYLSCSFIIKDLHKAILPLSEINNRHILRRPKQRHIHHVEDTSDLLDVEIGDLVVHFNYGIGKYLGIEKKPNHLGILSEFLVIEYKERSKLFVPIAQAFLISKYVGASESLPTLHDLNSNKWKLLRTKTEGAILGYAKDLLELYAKRSHDKGISYPQDSQEFLTFENDFPYEVTDDQKLAIESIKKDMMSAKCMDRLICGDVGFGKTEVAMRAAFKACVDGKKQVAVLVPTTVLAMQHFESFKERMRNFAINIKVISRFCTAKEIKSTLKMVSEGSVDILIGTHRLVSKDVQFKNLGLIIIDEEQRFGVKVKEELKKSASQIDCLTLSATPIPRTLYMSLVGARDMSVIATPPHDRLPIKTILAKSNDEVLKLALIRELSRDGQAFIIHNRVETIFEMKDRISKLVPKAKVLVVHGQMSSEEIDTIFHAYKEGQADILISTTIIESGIDIPNANTILIDRADQFGLSELYQLRGRVGRWNKRAYCYFLVHQNKSLSDIANKRLSALVATSGFGGGMRIAMRDLEIRGAGDLLGVKQSGHVASVGFHLYCKLLKKTIKALQGKGSYTDIETKLDFPFDARLPEDFVQESPLRLELYKRIGDLNNQEDCDTLFQEIKDRFGKFPLQVEWLYYLTRLKVVAQNKNYTLLKLQKFSLYTEKKENGRIIPCTYSLTITKDPKMLIEKILNLL